MKQQDFLHIEVTGVQNLHFNLLCSNVEELRIFVSLICNRFSVPIDHTAAYLGKYNEKYPLGTYKAMLTKNQFDLTLNNLLRKSALQQIGIRIEGKGFSDDFSASYIAGDFLIELFAAANNRGWELFQWHGTGKILLVK